MGNATALPFDSRSEPFGLRVLLASPDPSLRASLTRELRGDGHRVVDLAASSELSFATELVERRLAPCPDLVVLDAELGILPAGRLARCPLFLLVDLSPATLRRQRVVVERAISDDAASALVTLFRKPIEVDEVRVAVMDLEAHVRSLQEPHTSPMARATSFASR